AHVHLHPSFDATVFLNAASQNFGRAARMLDGADDPVGCLIFTEEPRKRSFAHVLDRLTAVGEEWEIAHEDDGISAWAQRRNDPPILLLAGRQLVTDKGLEVLALCSDEPFASDKSLGDTLEAVRAAGAVPVLPWGFGKWWFARGALLRDLLDGSGAGTMFLGDQAGRPARGTPPALFERARRRGIWTLPGTDPLPFRRHQDRAGSYGFALSVELPAEQPGGALRDALLALEAQPPVYGQGAGLWQSLRDQLGMQLRKRLGGVGS
ncbi:MAG: hypothetical protein ACR2F9_07955, partial [Longimicrobiaceae bacterium]